MKLSKLSQLFLVSAIGLILAAGLTGCYIATIDYVFVATSGGSSSGTTGQIYTYAADAESGALRPVHAAISSGGNSPIAMAVDSTYADLYVANEASNTVIHFAIASDGTLSQKDSITTAEPPAAIIINQADSYLYVVTGTTSATLTEYSLSNGVIGSPVASETLSLPGYSSDTLVPTAVAVLPNNNAVYAAAYDSSAYSPGCPSCVTSNANPGWVFGFSVGSGGALSTLSQSPYEAGVKPSGLAPDPTNRFVYATDYASNQLIGYTIQGNYQLDFMVNGPFKTGNEPVAVIVDPRGLFIYVANALDSTVSAYSIALSTGTPSAAYSTTGTTSNQTDSEPVAIVIDPSLGRYVYTANHLADTVSGFRLNPNTGVLQSTIATPYPSGRGPSAIAAVPHGNYAVQTTAP
ncbi:MAG TPA: beta-propeller fold lactonase family protein [Terracidiphilus sp.]|nr:beta-propeller fold lactonase family protein [Terracidiphilus sp.]